MVFREVPGPPAFSPVFFADLPLFALWTIVAMLAVTPLLDARMGLGAFAARAGVFDLTFFGAVLIALVACRAGVLNYRGELNIDECQFVAQALGYHRDLMPFTQDGHTCGPLNYYILMWPAYLGQPITYFTIRLTGLVLIMATLVSTVRTLAYLVERRWSYLLALPLISFYFFAYQPGFVHFSSEHLPEALLAVAIWLIAQMWETKTAQSGGLFLLGLILGATPFTKLQGAPLAIFLFALAAALLKFDAQLRDPNGQRRWAALIALTIGGAIVPAIMGVTLAAGGTLGDSIYRYIIVNAVYGAQLWIPDPHPFGYMLYEFAHNGPQYTLYLFDLTVGTVLGLAVLLRFRERIISREWLVGFTLVLIFMAIACYSVVKPRQAFCHYLLFLPVPTLLVIGWTARGVARFCPADFLRARQRTFIAFFVAISVFTLPLYVTEQRLLPYLATPPSTEYDSVSAYIRSVAGPDDTISNWGYTPQYYVETQLPPGVRDYSTLFEIFPDKAYDYFRRGYLEDLKKNKPKVIVDSVGERYLPTWAHPIDQARATAWPPLAEYLAANYAPPVAMTTSPDRPPVLVYVRNP
jgi:hypothetical protein